MEGIKRDKIKEEEKLREEVRKELRREGGISERSRLAALLLVFFLGGFGIHRFYVGKIGTGIILLLLTISSPLFMGATLVLTGIWVLVDLILILVGNFKDKMGLRLERW